MVVINRIDRISKNESDQFMTGQYIDLLLAHSSLVLITLPNHPATLGLHPSLASRLSAGFLFHIPNAPSSDTNKRKKGGMPKDSTVLLSVESLDTKKLDG